MLTRCQHLAGPASLGASPSSGGDRTLSTSALHRRRSRTCVIEEVPDQTSFDLAGDGCYSASRTGSRAWPLTPAMSRQGTVFDNAERCQSGLRDDSGDAEAPYRPHPRCQGQSERVVTGGVVSRRDLTADLKHARIT